MHISLYIYRDILSYSRPSGSRNENTVRRNNPLRDIGAFLTPDGSAPKSFRYHLRVNTTPTQTLFHPHSQGVVLNLCANTVGRLQYGARPNVYTPPPRRPPPPPRRHMPSALTATDRPTDDRSRSVRGVCHPRRIIIVFNFFVFFFRRPPARQSPSSECNSPWHHYIYSRVYT